MPFDIAAGLLEEGLVPEDVGLIHPSVDARSAQGAPAFARYLDGYRDVATAA